MWKNVSYGTASSPAVPHDTFEFDSLNRQHERRASVESCKPIQMAKSHKSYAQHVQVDISVQSFATLYWSVSVWERYLWTIHYAKNICFTSYCQ